MSKCDKGEEYSKEEKDCVACKDTQYNNEKGGKPCKERTVKCGKGQSLDNKDKGLEQDNECKNCEPKTFSAAEDGATECGDWKDKCPKGQGWAAGSAEADATCTACAKGKFSDTDDDTSECQEFSQTEPSDCKAGEKIVEGTPEKDSKCVAVTDGMFRTNEMKEEKKWRDSCPAGEELSEGVAEKDRECNPCQDGFFKDKEGNAECKKLQVCTGKGEVPAEGAAGQGSKTANRVCQCKEGWKKVDSKVAGEIDCEPKNPCTNGNNNCDSDKKAKCNYKGPGKFDCTCLPGFFSKSATKTDPCKDWKKTCPAGTELDGGSATEDKICKGCVAGKFKSTDDGADCKDMKKTCPKGEELKGGSARADKTCEKCGATSWKPNAGADKCQARLNSCKPGEQVEKGANGWTNNECAPCPANTYKSSAGVGKCKPHTAECGAGKILKDGTRTQNARCEGCTLGKFKIGTNNAKKCTPWTKGCDKAGTYYRVGKADADRTCPACPANHYNTEDRAKAGNACVAFLASCPAGKEMVGDANDKTKARTCVQCPKGKFRSGPGKFGDKCQDQPTDASKCPIINKAAPYYNLVCPNPNGKDPDCRTIQLVCTPDEAKNAVQGAKSKCSSACNGHGHTFYEDAWMADLKAGLKLTPDSIFQSSPTLRNTDHQDPWGMYCVCHCRGQSDQHNGGNQANEYIFDLFKKGGPGCVKVNGGQTQCYSVGDPHPRTYSGLSYNYYQYGEYSFTYRGDYGTESRLVAGMLHPKIAGGIAAAMRSTSNDPKKKHDEICRIRHGMVRCSRGFGDAHFKNGNAYDKQDMENPNWWKNKAAVANAYKDAPAKCLGTNYWMQNKAGNNLAAHDAIKLSRWHNGMQMESSEGDKMMVNFWRSRCIKGQGHAGSGSRGNDGSGSCGYRYYLNAYMRIVVISRGAEDSKSAFFGICGTPQTNHNVDRVNTGLNKGTQSGRHDPPRNDFFRQVKLPGVAKFARQQTENTAKMDFRSYFWCEGDDNLFISKVNEKTEHPANGQRYWGTSNGAFLEEGAYGKRKFRGLRAAALIETADTPPEPEEKQKEEENEKKDVNKEAAQNGGEKDVQDPDKTENEVPQTDAQKACVAKGLNPKTAAFKDCVQDVAAVGKDKETEEDVLNAAQEQEKDDDEEEKEADKKKKDDDKDEKTAEKEGAKDSSDPSAPVIEACIMGAGADCTKDSSFTKVVALPSATFDKKEWNTIKVVLPVKKGEKVAVRFAQKQTDCECCNDFGIDSLQFLTGDECYPASINEDAWQK
jgi:hypothetical protein